MRKLVASVDVARPAREVYDAWTRFEEFPSFMPGIVAVRQLDDRSTQWVVVVGRERREFPAVVTEQLPDHRIAWRSLGAPPHAGVVTFHRLATDRTRVTVQLDWEPQGLFDKIADRLGILRRHIDACLVAFRDLVEARPAPVPGWRGTIDQDDGGRDWGRDGDGAPSALGDGTGVRGPGHQAASPDDLPAAGWRQVLKRTGKELKADNVPIVAAGVAFFAFLALVPSLLAVISIYGLVADPAHVERQLESFLGALPEDAADLVLDQARSVTEGERAALGVGLAVSVLAALWSASRAMQSLISALNIAYDEHETRKFLKLRGLSMGLTVGAAVAMVGMVGGLVGTTAVARELGTAGRWALAILRWPVLGALVILGLGVLYRYGPNRDTAEWRWVTPGAALATVLWLLASFGFATYVNNFGSYNETYGTLAAVVVLLLWFHLSAYIVILGAELDSEMERQTAYDTTVGPVQPMGTRGAHVADTVAAEPVGPARRT